MTPRRVLAIALDATDRDLMRRLVEAGELPVLARLMREGATAALESDGDWMPESVWSTLHSGCTPGTHGVYQWRAPRAGEYVPRRMLARSWRRPWWELLRGGAAPESGPPRVILLDVPWTAALREEGMVHVHNWGQRGGVSSSSWPPGLVDELNARHGRYAPNMNREVTGRPLLARNQLRSILRMTPRRAELVRTLMAERSWEVLIAVFPEVHHAAHAFHQYAPGLGRLEAAPRGRGLEDALVRCYRSADEALGRLVDAAPDDATVAVFSGIGLRSNTSGQHALPRLLTALGYHVPAAPAGSTRRVELARRLALTVVPRPLARRVRARLATPEEIDAHVERLADQSTDWARTRAWCEMEAGSAWVRINLRGRERDGTVEPGREYEELVDEIRGELFACTDDRTGRPAIVQVERAQDIVPGPRSAAMPDLFVRFTRKVAVRALRHPRAGVFPEASDGWRATEHNSAGWLTLHGPGVRAGASAPDGRAVDFAPTLMHLLGGAVPGDMEGRVLEELLDGDGRCVRTVDADARDDPWAHAVT
jgi:predicted AlkP superfamily phosphohydrolase/phosphomutase